MKKKKLGSWAALKKQVQQCSCMYSISTFEDVDDTTQEFGTNCKGPGVSTTGQSRDDEAAMAAPSQCRHESSTYDSISEHVDEGQKDDVCKVLSLKHRHRSLAEQLELPNASPVRILCNAPGAPCLAKSGLQHSGASFKHVYRSGPVRKLASVARAGAEADCGSSQVGRSGCRASGKLSESACRRRSGSAKLVKKPDKARPNVIGRGIDVEDSHAELCATSSRSDSSQGRLIRRLEKNLELQPTLSTVSTRMSRTDPRRRIPRKQPRPRIAAAVGIKHGWNASTRSAQDCQALLRDKERALMKRERALKYAHSIRRYKQYGARRKGLAGEPWPSKEAARTPDKPGWVWSWLERAARMGVANGPRDNRVFDNDSNSRNGRSESSLSVQSTIAMCTTGQIAADGAGPDHDELWHQSLRKPHEAKSQCVSRLPNSNHTTTPISRAPSSPADQPAPNCAQTDQPPQDQTFRHSWTTSEDKELLQSPVSMSKFKYARLYSTRRITFWKKQVVVGGMINCKQDVEVDSSKDNLADESVGSCAAAPTAAPSSSKLKLSSHFSKSSGGSQRVPKSSQCTGAAATQLKLPNSSNMSRRSRDNFAPPAETAPPTASLATTRAAHGDGDEDQEQDSISSTATSSRKKKKKKFRKPV